MSKRGTLIAAAVFASASGINDYQGIAWIGGGIAVLTAIALFMIDGFKFRVQAQENL